MHISTIISLAQSAYASLPTFAQIQAFPGAAYAALPSIAQISAKASAFKAAALTPQGAGIAAVLAVTLIGIYIILSSRGEEEAPQGSHTTVTGENFKTEDDYNTFIDYTDSQVFANLTWEGYQAHCAENDSTPEPMVKQLIPSLAQSIN